MKKTDPPIIVEATYPTSTQKVWFAITELNQLQKWFFPQIPQFKAKEGFETQFVVENEGRTFTHLWKIVEVVPLKKIKYNWRYKEWEGDSFVTFELFEEGDDTRLRLSTEVIADFPSDIPEFKRDSGVQGWEYFLQNSLQAYLNDI